MRERVTELKTLAANNEAARAEKAQTIASLYAEFREPLARTAPERERTIGNLIKNISASNGRNVATVEDLDKQLLALRNDLPPNFLPAEKLTRSIEAARKAKPDGIIIFAAGSLNREKLWSTLEEAFKR